MLVFRSLFQIREKACVISSARKTETNHQINPYTLKLRLKAPLFVHFLQIFSLVERIIHYRIMKFEIKSPSFVILQHILPPVNTRGGCARPAR